jgi:hypothetical protein
VIVFEIGTLDTVIVSTLFTGVNKPLFAIIVIGLGVDVSVPESKPLDDNENPDGRVIELYVTSAGVGKTTAVH